MLQTSLISKRKESNFMSEVVAGRCCAKALLKISQMSQDAEKPVQEFLSNNVAGLQTVNFVKKGLQLRCFTENFAKFLRTSF